MTQMIDQQLAALQTLRLPELQARFAEIVGEPTRAPNRTYLLRRIGEALAAQAAVETPEPEAAPEATPEPEVPTAEPAAAGATDDAPVRLSRLSVEELRERYVETVGRATRSQNANYLIWKIRQAERGQIPVGPRPGRQPGEPAVEHKVLPLRMPVPAIEALDAAWQRQGIKSRTELFRHALDQYLTGIGEGGAADLVRGR